MPEDTEHETPPPTPLEGVLIPPKRVPGSPTDLEQERWWQAYRANPTWGMKKLAAACRANVHRMKHAVHSGWPEKGIVAFKARILTSDKTGRDAVGMVTAEVQRQAIEHVAKVVIGTWEEAARAQLTSLNSATAALTKLAEALDRASAGASFVSYRRVPDVDEAGKIRRDEKGNAILVLKPFVSGHAVAMAAARLAVAAKDHAMLGKVLLGSLAPPARDDPEKIRDPRFMTTTERRARLQGLLARAAEAGIEPDPDPDGETADAG